MVFWLKLFLFLNGFSINLHEKNARQKDKIINKVNAASDGSPNTIFAKASIGWWKRYAE